MTLHEIKADGERVWFQIWDGLITEREGVSSNPWQPRDRTQYAAWRMGFEQARDRTIREYPI
jgi:hypothetical protein